MEQIDARQKIGMVQAAVGRETAQGHFQEDDRRFFLHLGLVPEALQGAGEQVKG